ncbi:MAG: nicotinate-nicotinamide nucleotide adenylyltransferase [Polyangiaceae bacterium]|nr:nicotinate-nicotinamide nucleotide adenylyltransferase [Polyangiaceae bacterium]
MSGAGGRRGSPERDTPRTVAFFGGSFDPPHVAHVLAACYALAVEELDTVLVVPVLGHAFGKPLAPFEHRVHMAELAFQGVRGAEISGVERALPAPSYTLHTLRHLATTHPSWRLRLLIGADVLDDAPRWHAFDEVCELAQPLVLGRRGVERSDAPRPWLPEVSSTRVRELLGRAGDADAAAELAACVPRSVLRHIAEHGLYGAS